MKRTCVSSSSSITSLWLTPVNSSVNQVIDTAHSNVAILWRSEQKNREAGQLQGGSSMRNMLADVTQTCNQAGQGKVGSAGPEQTGQASSNSPVKSATLSRSPSMIACRAITTTPAKRQTSSHEQHNQTSIRHDSRLPHIRAVTFEVPYGIPCTQRAHKLPGAPTCLCLLMPCPCR